MSCTKGKYSSIQYRIQYLLMEGALKLIKTLGIANCNNVCTHTHTHTHTQVHTYSYYPIIEYLKWSGMVLSQSNILLLFSRYVKGYIMRGDWRGTCTCTCTCNPCTYVFHNVGTFSIMQLGPESAKITIKTNQFAHFTL